MAFQHIELSVKTVVLSTFFFSSSSSSEGQQRRRVIGPGPSGRSKGPRPGRRGDDTPAAEARLIRLVPFPQLFTGIIWGPWIWDPWNSPCPSPDGRFTSAFSFTARPHHAANVLALLWHFALPPPLPGMDQAIASRDPAPTALRTRAECTGCPKARQGRLFPQRNVDLQISQHSRAGALLRGHAPAEGQAVDVQCSKKVEPLKASVLPAHAPGRQERAALSAVGNARKEPSLVVCERIAPQLAVAERLMATHPGPGSPPCPSRTCPPRWNHFPMGPGPVLLWRALTRSVVVEVFSHLA